MKPLILILLSVVVAQAQERMAPGRLAEFARKERDRRSQTPLTGKVYTSEETRRGTTSNLAITSPPSSPATSTTPKTTSSASTASRPTPVANAAAPGRPVPSTIPAPVANAVAPVKTVAPTPAAPVPAPGAPATPAPAPAPVKAATTAAPPAPAPATKPAAPVVDQEKLEKEWNDRLNAQRAAIRQIEDRRDVLRIQVRQFTDQYLAPVTDQNSMQAALNKLVDTQRRLDETEKELSAAQSKLRQMEAQGPPRR